MIVRIEKHISLTPEELAEEFLSLDADQQAIFFNEIGRQSDEWVNPFSFQLEAISQSKKLKASGRWIMRDIGEYSEGY